MAARKLDLKEPVIKGLFVNSHIKKLKQEKGEDGLKKLAKAYQKPITFSNSADVPIREEVIIIEHVLALLSDQKIPEKDRAFEAGRLHFRNFTETAYGKIIFSVFRPNFKTMMLQAGNIAGYIFKNVKFSSTELGDKHITVSMENNDYPIDHFRGLFYEWMVFSGRQGTVAATKAEGGNRFVYTMKWN